uniref:EGF-like domain-containing protein n=1 Tax=Panagrolaimus sp. JU765 TaxID=591449 RepID=A0AC34QNJ0_9BILA
MSNALIDFCWEEEPNSCGSEGKCILQKTGNRCLCPDGFMGFGCKRPCQDIYKSCQRWFEERRCEWAKPISPFFFDNCPLSCGRCKSGDKKLKMPLPPILEPLSWLIGRWRTRTLGVGFRFPVFLDSAYDEILDFGITQVPSFDRPPLSVRIHATLISDKTVQHDEVGFMTVKPFKEDTGFLVQKAEKGDDLVAIEMVSNNGLITIEEGILLPNEIHLSVVHKISYLGDNHPSIFMTANRSFHLLSEHILEERVRMITNSGKIIKFRKKYFKIFDYLTDFI